VALDHPDMRDSIAAVPLERGVYLVDLSGLVDVNSPVVMTQSEAIRSHDRCLVLHDADRRPTVVPVEVRKVEADGSNGTALAEGKRSAHYSS
jgi:hypothetical protein